MWVGRSSLVAVIVVAGDTLFVLLTLSPRRDAPPLSFEIIFGPKTLWNGCDHEFGIISGDGNSWQNTTLIANKSGRASSYKESKFPAT